MLIYTLPRDSMSVVGNGSFVNEEARRILRYLSKIDNDHKQTGNEQQQLEAGGLRRGSKEWRDYGGPNLPRYSVELMKALTISASTKFPLN